MVIGTNNFIETLPLNDCQPRLKSNLTTHEMEVILRQLSNWYVKRTIRLDTNILSCFHRLSLKMGFLIHSHDIKWTPEAGVFISKFFFKKLYYIQKGKWLWVLLRIYWRLSTILKISKKVDEVMFFLINRNFENVRYFNKLFIFFLNLFIFLID